jgi:hypothetical protein
MRIKKFEILINSLKTMNSIILIKVFDLTNNINDLTTYYKNIIIKQRDYRFPKISYSSFLIARYLTRRV